MTLAINPFSCSYSGCLILSVFWQISYSASFYPRAHQHPTAQHQSKKDSRPGRPRYPCSRPSCAPRGARCTARRPYPIPWDSGRLRNHRASLFTTPSAPHPFPHTPKRGLTIRILLPDLAQQQRAQPAARSAAEGVQHLEPLQAVRAFRLAARDIEDRVDELRALGVVPLGPVVSGAALGLDTPRRSV
jgi:hypothetical protein